MTSIILIFKKTQLKHKRKRVTRLMRETESILFKKILKDHDWLEEQENNSREM